MHRLAATLLATAALAACGAAGTTDTVFLTPTPLPTGTSGPTATVSAAPSGPALTKTYTSSTEGIHFTYPAIWTVRAGTASGPNDNPVVFMSPAGTELDLHTDVEGIGGACPPGSAPNVVITHVVANPHITNAWVVTTSVAGKGDSIELTVPRDNSPAPTPGDTGGCFDVPQGMAARHSQGILWLATARGTAPADEATVVAILESASY